MHRRRAGYCSRREKHVCSQSAAHWKSSIQRSRVWEILRQAISHQPELLDCLLRRPDLESPPCTFQDPAVYSLFTSTANTRASIRAGPLGRVDDDCAHRPRWWRCGKGRGYPHQRRVGIDAAGAGSPPDVVARTVRVGGESDY